MIAGGLFLTNEAEAHQKQQLCRLLEKRCKQQDKVRYSGQTAGQQTTVTSGVDDEAVGPVQALREEKEMMHADVDMGTAGVEGESLQHEGTGQTQAQKEKMFAWWAGERFTSHVLL